MQTTMQYIHLSGNDLLAKMARSVEHGDANSSPFCFRRHGSRIRFSDAGPYTSKIDLSRYDRAPELTCDERRIASRWAAPERPVISKRQLPRLYAPLADVLSYQGIAESERSTTVKIVLVEVGRSQQPNWGWSDDQWLALINRQSTRTGLLLATAYLLSGFKRFYDVERNAHLLVTARVVFGRNVFDRESGRLMTALDRVGFKCSSMRSFMPSVIAAVALEGEDPRLDRFDDALSSAFEAFTVDRSASASSC